MSFAVAVLLVAVLGGTMTGLAGAGTGSTLVPLLALHFDFKLAVAAVAVPHLAASAIRAFQLRKEIDRGLFQRFGLVCAVTSLIGALAQTAISSPTITYVFAVLLALAALLGLGGWSERKHGSTRASWIAGVITGFFGGLAGEQGGFRAVGLMGFDLKKEAFVATGAAVGVVIDLVRTPVYWFQQWDKLRPMGMIIVLAAVGAICGILIGGNLLHRVPQERFARVVAGVILVIGALLFFHRPD